MKPAVVKLISCSYRCYKQPNAMENLLQQHQVTQYFNLPLPHLGFPVKYQAVRVILSFSGVPENYFLLALVDAERAIV